MRAPRVSLPSSPPHPQRACSSRQEHGCPQVLALPVTITAPTTWSAVGLSREARHLPLAANSTQLAPCGCLPFPQPLRGAPTHTRDRFEQDDRVVRPTPLHLLLHQVLIEEATRVYVHQAARPAGALQNACRTAFTAPSVKPPTKTVSVGRGVAPEVIATNKLQTSVFRKVCCRRGRSRSPPVNTCSRRSNLASRTWGESTLTARCRQFNGQRQPIQASTDFGDRLAVDSGQLEREVAWPGRVRRRGRTAYNQYKVFCGKKLVEIGSVNGGTGNSCSP